MARYPLRIHHVYNTVDETATERVEPLGLWEIVHHPVYQKPGAIHMFSPKSLKLLKQTCRELFESEAINVVHIRSPHTPMDNSVAKLAQEMDIPTAMTFHMAHSKLLPNQPIQIGMSLVQRNFLMLILSLRVSEFY